MTLIRQIKLSKSNGQKFVFIPKNESLEAGDYVIVKKLEVE